ncbi:MAG: DUF1844 domain-containing protein [Verrucomicrobiota bacterium]|nr:DUF1844 domain-containing protein [Verrucomicrobiota bacterium]
MAEVQTSTQSGALAQRFIEFVMMQAQNASLFLGQIPNPQTGEGEVNLDLAKMFIDQLAMIQEKTRGNLSNEESTVLKNTLANLQMAFVEVSQGGGAQSSSSSAAVEREPEPISETPATAQPAAPTEPTVETPSPESESRKKFTKSYGA